ncbi:MAG: chloride channel protein [Paramuribaculum sp.]|nr:chloride channel protein [Paramuribaculum sp.]
MANDNENTATATPLQPAQDPEVVAESATESPQVKSRLDRIADWREKHIPDTPFLFIMSVVSGLAIGTAAFILKWTIGMMTKIVAHGMKIAHGNWVLLVVPLLGIVLTGIFVRYVLRTDITHGVSKIMKDLKVGIYKLKAMICYAPILASSITLGFGGSAGSEGPIAYVGAGIGSNLARIFRLNPRLMMIMLSCGAGAGIAGIFKSPIGGFLFTLEVLKVELTSVTVMALLTSTLTAAMTSYVLSGCTNDLSFFGYHPFEPHLMPWFILLGVFTGFYSLYYSGVMTRMEKFYDSRKNPWIENIIGGLILAAAIFLFPVLYGEGYEAMSDIMNGNTSLVIDYSPLHSFFGYEWIIIISAGAILLLKSFAASASNSAGGVAGDFAPTLFAGCIAGLFFAELLNKLFGLELPFADFCFVGMAGVMAGAVRAPLMALFITVEMTACYTLFLPVFIVSGISFGIVRLFTSQEYYAFRDRRKHFTNTDLTGTDTKS